MSSKIVPILNENKPISMYSIWSFDFDFPQLYIDTNFTEPEVHQFGTLAG